MLVLFVYSAEQAEEVCLGSSGVVHAMDPGGLVIIHTTMTTQALKKISAAASDRQLAVVDAPVSGTAADVDAGCLTVLLAGLASDVDRAREVVAAYASPVIDVGPAGAATKVKLINNVLFAANLQLAAQAWRLAEQLEVDPGAASRAILSSSGTSAALSHVSAMNGPGPMAAGAARYLEKDFRAARLMALEAGWELGVLGDAVETGPLPIIDDGLGSRRVESR